VQTLVEYDWKCFNNVTIKRVRGKADSLSTSGTPTAHDIIL